MSQKLDGKFHGLIVKNKDSSIVPQDEWIVFLAKDDALLPTLRHYQQECHQLGASADQLRAIGQLISRVVEWRAANTCKCKVPDVEPGEIVL